MVYRETWRRVWLDDNPQESVHALAMWSTAAIRNMPAGCSLAEQLHYARQGHGRSGASRDYVLATVKELETLGYPRRRSARPGRRSSKAVTEASPCRLKLMAPDLAVSFSPAPPQSAAPSQFRCRFAGARKTPPCRGRAGSDRESPPTDRTAEPPERSARPEQAGIERNRNARHAALRHKDARRRTCSAARRPAGRRVPSGKMMSWRPSASSMRRAFDHVGQGLRAAAAIDRHHAAFDGEPAEDRNPLQLALEDEHRIVEQRQQRESFPRRLVLGGNDDRPFREFSRGRGLRSRCPQPHAAIRDSCGPMISRQR